VVTTPNSGSIVRDRIDGFIVSPRDVEGLEERILFLFREPDIRWEMGARGRALVAESYTWTHYRERLCTVYEAILGGRNPSEALDPMFDGGFGSRAGKAAVPGG